MLSENAGCDQNDFTRRDVADVFCELRPQTERHIKVPYPRSRPENNGKRIRHLVY